MGTPDVFRRYSLRKSFNATGLFEIPQIPQQLIVSTLYYSHCRASKCFGTYYQASAGQSLNRYDAAPLPERMNSFVDLAVCVYLIGLCQRKEICLAGGSNAFECEIGMLASNLSFRTGVAGPR